MKLFVSTLLLLASAAKAQNSTQTGYAQAVDMRIAKFVDQLRDGPWSDWKNQVTFREDTKPFGELLAEVTPRFSKDSTDYSFDVRVPVGGLKNPFVVQEILLALGEFGIDHVGRFDRRYSEIFRELWFEAANGSIEAALDLSARGRQPRLEFRFDSLDPQALNDEMMKRAAQYFQLKQQPMPQDVNDYRALLVQIHQNQEARIDKRNTDLMQRAAQEHKTSVKEWESQKQTLKLMEKVFNDKKLNELVKANDRKGVRDLLEAFLPWPLMGKMEREAWKIWLDAIEKPDTKNATLLFRGLDNKDQPQETIYQGRRSLGLFSTLLTRNQGNYNRRLLSIGAKRSKIRHFLSSYFYMHAEAPLASEFISFTSKPTIADRFADYGQDLVIAKIDKRRAIPNTVGVRGEAEILVPLVVFPDEIISIHKKTNNYIPSEVVAKVRELGLENEILLEDSKLYGRGREFFRELALRAYSQIRMSRAPINSCRRIFSVRQ